MRVLISGDTHGNLPWTLHLLDKAVEFNVQQMMILGDFGFWPRQGWGRDFLYKLNHQLKKCDIPLFWLDGNHEDHQELQKLIVSRNKLVQIRECIFHCPRGYLGHWDQVSFVTLGGAFSIDKKHRTESKNWFAEENITDEDIAHIASHKKADILLSHEMPLGVPLVLHNSHHLHDVDKYPEAFENQNRVHNTAWFLRVKKIFHGHHHTAYRSDMMINGNATECGYTVKVEGLACDHQNGAWTVLDTEKVIHEF